MEEILIHRIPIGHFFSVKISRLSSTYTTGSYIRCYYIRQQSSLFYFSTMCLMGWHFYNIKYMLVTPTVQQCEQHQTCLWKWLILVLPLIRFTASKIKHWKAWHFALWQQRLDTSYTVIITLKHEPTNDSIRDLKACVDNLRSFQGHCLNLYW